MQCDFQNVTDILYRNRKSSKQVTYNIIVNTLLGSYLKENSIYEFPDYTLSKLHKGTIGVAPEVKDYYQYADPDKVKKDIQATLDYLFDKPNTYHELYRLIQFDEALSVSMRSDILQKYPDTFTDDNTLSNLLYEAIYTAITRLYYKDENRVATKYFSEDIALIGDTLFRNSEYIPPCKHFCGRDKELKELHDVITGNSTVIITGVAGIGKSELIRAYAREHKKEYPYFGYYFYDSGLKDIIADVLRDQTSTDLDLDTRYQNNLRLLNELGEKVLLIIDNFNVTPDTDECFDDICDLKCKVVFTSHMRFEDHVTYELQPFCYVNDTQTLTRYFYPYKADEWHYLLQIYGSFGFHTFCVELCARACAKGVFTPKSLYKNYHTFKLKDFAEKLSAKKDKHPKKKTYFDHIRELFRLFDLPERHKQVLRVMVFAPSFGFRKDFFAKLMNLSNMVIIEDLLDVGLIYENHRGRLCIHSVVAELVRSELETTNKTCSDFVEVIRALCLNEVRPVEIHDKTISALIATTFYWMDFTDTKFKFRYIHDCFTFTERFGETGLNDDMIRFEEQNHRDVPELKALYLSDAAAYEVIKQHFDRAIDFQMQAVECVMKCDNTILQANTFSTYGYYLNLADRKDDALKAMRSGLALFGQLDGGGAFYFDRYRAIINYADLMFALGHTNDAVKMISDARAELQENELQNTGIYADCEYSLGIYHLCLNDSSAGDEIISSFRTFISLYGKESDFIKTRINEVKTYIDMNNINITSNKPLCQLLGE